VRQEKGQDIAGACGQLALVNPGNVTAPAAGGDIEDMAGSGGAGAGKGSANGAAGKGKGKKGGAECSGDAETCQSAECTGGSRGSSSDGGKKTAGAEVAVRKKELSRSALWCVANLLVPVGLLVVGAIQQQ
jgi:hypothetical protein